MLGKLIKWRVIVLGIMWCEGVNESVLRVVWSYGKDGLGNSLYSSEWAGNQPGGRPKETWI